jgi:predicted nucleic acid-binding protein
MTARVFVDTNVFVYNRDLSEKEKRPRAGEWLAYLWGKRSGRLSMQVLQEFYITVTEKLDPKIPRVSVRQDIRDLMAWRPIMADAKLVESAWDFQDRFKIAWWDSLIVAAAHAAHCRYILTEDFQDGQVFDKLTIVNPFRHDPNSILESEEQSQIPH